MRAIMWMDRKQKFRFLTAQSEMGQDLYRHYGLRGDNFDTFLVFRKGQMIDKMDGVLAIATSVGWPWRLAGIAYVVPRRVRNWFYDRLARNRYRIFGRYDTCMVPGPEIRARFID